MIGEFSYCLNLTAYVFLCRGPSFYIHVARLFSKASFVGLAPIIVDPSTVHPMPPTRYRPLRRRVFRVRIAPESIHACFA